MLMDVFKSFWVGEKGQPNFILQWVLKSLTISSIGFLSVSCNQFDKKGSDTLSYDHYLGDTLTLKLDNLATFEVFHFQYFQNEGEESLFVLNVINQSLDQYNLLHGNMVKRIDLNIDPMYQRGQFNSFYIHNLDSIFLFQRMTLLYSKLINDRGEVKTMYMPSNPLDGENELAFNHVTIPSSPKYLINDKLYFAIWTVKNTTFQGSVDRTFKANAIFDLNSDSVFLTPQPTYPNSYLGKGWVTDFVAYSRILGHDGSWIYSWPALDSLILFSTDLSSSQSIVAKSDFSAGFEPHGFNLNTEERFTIPVSETHYGRIVFDPFRKLYYRIVSIGRSPFLEEIVGQESLYRNKFSVLILNQDLSLKQEVVFPSETYNPWGLFVGEKGLYLPKINILYKGLDEDLVEYDIFDFTKNGLY